eukprot:3166813-Rhodomonas_salina.2
MCAQADPREGRDADRCGAPTAKSNAIKHTFRANCTRNAFSWTLLWSEVPVAYAALLSAYAPAMRCPVST